MSQFDESNYSSLEYIVLIVIRTYCTYLNWFNCIPVRFGCKRMQHCRSSQGETIGVPLVLPCSPLSFASGAVDALTRIAKEEGILAWWRVSI